MKNNARVSNVSYEAIAASAARLELTPEVYANLTATADKAPFLLRVVPIEALDADAYFQRVSEVTKHTFEETRRENGLRMELIAALFEEGYTHVDTGYITYELRIAGSVTSTTDQPDSEANYVYIGAYPSNELAATLAKISARQAAGSAPFAINTVFGADSHDRFVTGGKDCHVNGTKFAMDAEGAKVELVFPDGTVEAAVMKEWKPTYIRCVAPLGKEAKTVELRVTSGDGNGGVTTIAKPNVPFKYATAPVEPPKVTLVCADDREGDPEYADKLVEGQGVHFYGENLAGVTSLKMQYCKESDGNPHDKAIDLGLISYEGDGHLTLGTDFWSDGWADDWDRGTACRFTLATAGGTVTHDASAYVG